MKNMLIGAAIVTALAIANPDLNIFHLRWWIAMLILSLADPIISLFATRKNKVRA